MARFGFRQIDYRDLAMFLQDGEIRSKNHLHAQACHQTSHANLVQMRGEPVFTLPHGGVVNDYVALYFSPVTGFAYSVHKGKTNVIAPDGRDLGVSSAASRIFLVVNVAEVVASGLQVSFSNSALNKQAPQPVVIDDYGRLPTHVNWALFDEAPLVCAIPEIGYAGVHGWCQDKDSPPKYQVRSSSRMAELLVKDALPVDLIACIVVPSEAIFQAVSAVAHQYGFRGQIVKKSGCFV